MLSHMECNSKFDMNYEYIGIRYVHSYYLGNWDCGSGWAGWAGWAFFHLKLLENKELVNHFFD